MSENQALTKLIVKFQTAQMLMNEVSEAIQMLISIKQAQVKAETGKEASA